tara:strand:+ start:324 stop:515 length:192 start_codon:yes stop_codon:yes gene_type:complete
MISYFVFILVYISQKITPIGVTLRRLAYHGPFGFDAVDLFLFYTSHNKTLLRNIPYRHLMEAV